MIDEKQQEVIKPIQEHHPLSLSNEINGGTSSITISGATFLRISEASYPVKLYLDNTYSGIYSQGDRMQLSGGSDRVTISNTVDDNNEVVLTYGNGSVSTDALVISKTLNVNTSGGGSITTRSESITSTAQKLIVSNSKRFRIGLHNTGINTVFIGSDNLNVLNGWEIEADEKLYLDVSADIYMMCDSTKTSTVKILEGIV